MLQYLLIACIVVVQAQNLTLEAEKRLKILDDLKAQQKCLQVTIENTCPNQNVTFWLYNNQSNNYHLNEFDISTIQNAPFNDEKIKILLHGYTGNKDYSPNTQIRPKYLGKNYNVISIDYGPVVRDPCYIQSVSNALTVADCFTNFINLLLTTKIERRTSKEIVVEDIHVIGFSLGAQIAGDMGHMLFDKYGFKLPRITVLDPAAPLFYGPDTRVDKSSAEFVDCLHTNSFVLGKFLPVGTADFFFNYIFTQKGCSAIDFSCNHGRAPEYFAESITTKNYQFCGRKLTPDLKNSTPRVLVGEYIKLTTSGAYFVETNKDSPYAKDHC